MFGLRRTKKKEEKEMSDEITNQESGESVTPEEQQPRQAQHSPKEPTDNTGDLAGVLREILQQFQAGLPIAFKTAAPSPEEKVLMGKINDRLVGIKKIPSPRGEECIRPLSVAFPQCSDVMLSLVKITEDGKLNKDDIMDHFDEYFMFCDHNIIAGNGVNLGKVLDTDLLNCTEKWFTGIPNSKCKEDNLDIAKDKDNCPQSPQVWQPKWPSPWCLPPSCVTLAGKRHLYTIDTKPPSGSIKRLFIADIIWLFYFERMGIFKILGVILDDFATKGKIPISNGVIDAGIKDDVIAIALESMVRQTKMGLSSTVRDRDSSYRRCIGWTSDVGRKLGLDTVTNIGLNTLFHRFIQLALEFYKDKRLATAIQGVTTPVSKTSVATLLTISDTLDLLKKAFDPFDYGRNYSNTLNGIVWVIAGMTLIRELRTTLGIPAAYDKPYEYIPAAYDLLVLRRPITPSGTNRYTVHRECANDARDILLDLEVINHQDNSAGGELELWLSIIEGKVEGYRTAYRSLTGVDLGAPGTPTVEQQV